MTLKAKVDAKGAPRVAQLDVEFMAPILIGPQLLGLSPSAPQLGYSARPALRVGLGPGKKERKRGSVPSAGPQLLHRRSVVVSSSTGELRRRRARRLSRCGSTLSRWDRSSILAAVRSYLVKCAI
ncbi:hypothetical protein NL676_020595 [Syzygium grande]|nr:hypothetical protein NL676_020595 [Syzygium grande]